MRNKIRQPLDHCRTLDSLRMPGKGSHPRIQIYGSNGGGDDNSLRYVNTSAMIRAAMHAFRFTSLRLPSRWTFNVKSPASITSQTRCQLCMHKMPTYRFGHRPLIFLKRGQTWPPKKSTPQAVAGLTDLLGLGVLRGGKFAPSWACGEDVVCGGPLHQSEWRRPKQSMTA